MVNLTINGITVKVPAGTTILEAANSVGIEIPTLCHHPALSKFGACRMCVVEVQGARNLSASCTTPVSEGMVVETESERVVRARRVILDLLLANHPMDCLTCQKLGECKLSDYAYHYGVRQTSFKGEKHDYPLDDSNPYIVRDMNKCILCGQCVRACEEIKGQSAIGFAYRSFSTQVGPPLDEPLSYSECVYCNNCVIVCPVGALTDKQLLNKGRSYEVEKEPVICSFCEAGCEFEIIRRKNKVIGVEAKAAAPGRPLCLKGRLGLNFIYNPEATSPPLLKADDGSWQETSWETALGLEQIINKLKQLEGQKANPADNSKEA
ncbi:MAG: 2Fe-2S iron-sulfur cluster binding domain-containing protein [Firmicutes bacterium]|nr:2Fe-2S iron-sulfur cluster binding domain-containing protein [Bacillota bacterium]